MALDVAFTVTGSPGPIPLTIGFAATGSGGTSPYDYAWNFGDGGTATGASPSYTYDEYGLFSVQCTITDATGDSHTSTWINAITVVAPNPGGGGEPVVLEPVYSYTESGAAYRWAWNQKWKMTRSRDANRVVGVMQADFFNEQSLARDLLGYAIYTPGQGYLNRTTPLQCPWRNTLYAVRWDMDQFGANPTPYGPTPLNVFADPLNSNFPNIDWMDLLVEFGQFPFTILDDDSVSDNDVPELQRYIRRTRRYQPSALKVPSTGLSALKNGTSFTEAYFIPETYFRPDIVVEHTYTQYMVPITAVPETAIRSSLGRVNKTPFDVGHGTYPPGTILFKGFASDLEWYYGPDEQKYYDIPWIFHERNNGPATYGDGTPVYVNTSTNIPIPSGAAGDGIAQMVAGWNNYVQMGTYGTTPGTPPIAVRPQTGAIDPSATLYGYAELNDLFITP